MSAREWGPASSRSSVSGVVLTSSLSPRRPTAPRGGGRLRG
jgi:hypothetical protein